MYPVSRVDAWAITTLFLLGDGYPLGYSITAAIITTLLLLTAKRQR